MTSSIVLSAAFLYGVPMGMLANVVLISNGIRAAQYPFLLPLACTIVLFILYRLTFARAWNRRANKLRATGAGKLA